MASFTGNLRSLVAAACASIVWANASAETIDLTSATIAEINEAIDAGALNSEKLVEMSLARVAAYDDAGPKLNAVMLLNPNALERARELDAERNENGQAVAIARNPRRPERQHRHGRHADHAGSFMLKGSIPPDDAFLTRQLRDAGAIIVAKLNMSEFASGDAMNSLDGPTYNPHDLRRTPFRFRPEEPAPRSLQATQLSASARTLAVRYAALPLPTVSSA